MSYAGCRHTTGDLPEHAYHTAGHASGRYTAAFDADTQSRGLQQIAAAQRQPSVPGVQSASERFAVMQQTLHQRITSGMLHRCSCGAHEMMAATEVHCAMPRSVAQARCIRYHVHRMASRLCGRESSHSSSSNMLEGTSAIACAADHNGRYRPAQ